MVNWSASTRRLEAAVGSSVSASESSITITFEDAEKKKLGVVFSLAVVPATITLLAARLDELVGHVDHQDRPEMQTLQCSSLEWAMNEEGRVALLIGLQGGGALPIQFGREQMATLKTALEEALAATDPRRRN